jgi:hypothetical protein
MDAAREAGDMAKYQELRDRWYAEVDMEDLPAG